MTQQPIEMAYGPEPEQSLDLHLGDRPSTAPLVVYVHGGGFQRGDKRDDAERIRILVGLGLNVASINYRLAPAWRHPAQVEDFRAAVAHLRRTGPEHGIDAAAIGAIGASAGGYIVAAATLGERNEASAVQAVSLWFASSDLVESTRRSPLEARISPVTYERALLGEDVDAAALEAASPARWGLQGVPPVLLVHGDSDKVVPPLQSAVLHDALARQGADTTLIRIGRAGHEDPAFDAEPLLGMVAAWMRARLTGAAEKEKER